MKFTIAGLALCLLSWFPVTSAATDSNAQTWSVVGNGGSGYAIAGAGATAALMDTPGGLVLANSAGASQIPGASTDDQGWLSSNSDYVAWVNEPCSVGQRDPVAPRFYLASAAELKSPTQITFPAELLHRYNTFSVQQVAVTPTGQVTVLANLMNDLSCSRETANAPDQPPARALDVLLGAKPGATRFEVLSSATATTENGFPLATSAYSPDGDTLAVCSSRGIAEVTDARASPTIRRFPLGKRKATTLQCAASTNGLTVAMVGCDSRVCEDQNSGPTKDDPFMMIVRSGRVIRVKYPISSVGNQMLVNPSGTLVVVAANGPVGPGESIVIVNAMSARESARPLPKSILTDGGGTYSWATPNLLAFASRSLVLYNTASHRSKQLPGKLEEAPTICPLGGDRWVYVASGAYESKVGRILLGTGTSLTSVHPTAALTYLSCETDSWNPNQGTPYSGRDDSPPITGSSLYAVSRSGVVYESQDSSLGTHWQLPVATPSAD